MIEYNLIYERRSTLAEAYLFELDGADRLTYAPPGGPGCLLRSSLADDCARFWRTGLPRIRSVVFEGSVAGMPFDDRGWSEFRGRKARGHGFQCCGECAGVALRVNASADAAPHNKKAQDEELTPIHHVPWCDPAGAMDGAGADHMCSQQ